MCQAVLTFTFKLAAVLASVAICAIQGGCASGVAVGEQGGRTTAGTERGSLILSTYLGGSGEDSIRDVATDAAGNVFIAGGTASQNFPVTSGSHDTSFNGTHDVFVAKLDPSGSLVWATFVGGPEYDRAYAIEVDSTGVYVAGRAGAGFPTTRGVAQPAFGGDVIPNAVYDRQDGFIAKLSLDGSRLLWATYFGGDGDEIIRDLDVDRQGNPYIAVTHIKRSNPHVTAGAFQTGRRGPSDGMVAKLTPDASSVVWATYFGGSGNDGSTPSIRVDSSGTAYYLTHTSSADAPVTADAFKRSFSGGDGPDLMLARISSDGSWLVFSTYIGGTGADFTETHGLAIDNAGNAYIAVSTLSTSLPATAGAVQGGYGGSGGSGTGRATNYPGDVYVAKVSADGTRLLAGTYLGGRHGEGAEGIAVDAQGNVYLSGATFSDDFPLTNGATQAGIGGRADLFAAKLSGDLRQLSFSSYIGGRDIDGGRAAAIDADGNFYVAGTTESRDWPTTAALQASYRGGNSDAVVAKIRLGAADTAPLPGITGASVSGKRLFVTGQNFGPGAELIVNDKKQKKTFNDPASPTTLLVAKKAGKKIKVGDTVRLQVRNPGGALSEVFVFTRPPDAN